MFSTLGLFRQIACSAPKCARINCPFSHVPVKQLPLPADDLKFLVATPEPVRPPHVSGKRAGSPSLTPDRPLKLQKTENLSGSASPSVPGSSRTVISSRPSSSSATSVNGNTSPLHGPPVINASTAMSKTPLVSRQALLTKLYDAFKDLYHRFHQARPDLAHKDALMQEGEVYAKTNKLTYKNVRL
jgi:RNA exonuclease 1